MRRRKLTLLGCILLCTACSPALRPWRLPDPDVRPPQGSAVAADQNRRTDEPEVQQGARVALYLNSGKRIEHTTTSPATLGSILAITGLRPEDVAAAMTVPRDRLQDGTLIGSAAGVGVAMGYGRLIAEGDFSGSVAVVSSIYGLAAGAGTGALLDAGIATAEKPLWIRPAPGLAASSARRLNIAVTPAALADWIRGRTVDMMSRSGIYWKGRIVHGNELEVELQVSDSSIKGQRGRRVRIMAEQIAAVTYRENVGGNRLSATLGGGLAGLFIGPLIGSLSDYDAANEAPLVVGAGAGLALGAITGLAVAERQNWREVTLSVQPSRPAARPMPGR